MEGTEVRAGGLLSLLPPPGTVTGVDAAEVLGSPLPDVLQSAGGRRFLWRYRGRGCGRPQAVTDLPEAALAGGDPRRPGSSWLGSLSCPAARSRLLPGGFCSALSSEDYYVCVCGGKGGSLSEFLVDET